MKRTLLATFSILVLPLLITMGLVWLTQQHHSRAAPLAGAIFTTTSDGAVVNENVHYDQKIEVYLDGGPGPNAPQHAAGLADGDYVFQVTDPSGKVLLSQDPSKCRVLRVANGVIVSLRDKADGSFTDHASNDACHVNDSPEGAPGATGKHDTNTDLDHGPPAIVVQLMPFFNTPNPGGVYKAWVIPLSRYVANGGSLEANPLPQCTRNGRPANNCNGNAVQIGYERDPGFGPPRDQVKTDNFKVREFFPPEIRVRKFHDVNGNGVWDPSEPEIGVDQCVDDVDGSIIPCPGGWPYDWTEPVDGGTVTNRHHTPATEVAGIPGTYTACEVRLPGWTQSAAYLDGVKHDADQCVSAVVAGTSGERHEIIFGNFMPGTISGEKFIDANANGGQDAGEGCPPSADVNHAGCAGITIHLFGTTGAGQALDSHAVTDVNGHVAFTDVPPGSYTLCEEVPAEFLQSYPASGPDCSAHPAASGGVVRDIGYAISISSGDSVEERDFGNYSLAEIRGIKFFDHDADGDRDAIDDGIADIEIHLDGTDGTGLPVHLVTYTCGGTQVPDCSGNPIGSYWFLDLVPGAYTVSEVAPPGFVQTFPLSPGTYQVDLTSDQVCTGKDFGNFGPCAGLTPGYWSNWRNHYTTQQFKVLLQGTVAHQPATDPVTNDDVTRADTYLTSVGCDNDDALACMRRFLLSDQLTLNLTQHPELPNPSEGSLSRICTLPDIGSLGAAIDQALAILANPDAYTRDQMLDAKNALAAFATR